LLDIGCGTGEFLNACKESGWNITGIEPSEIARKNAEQKYNITPLPQEKIFEINEKKFNVITLWHVLEHVHQLDKTMEQIVKILADCGTLIIAVPNCNSFDAKKYGAYWAAWDLPRHLYHFTKKDIETLFKKFGFGLTGILPMKFDSYYVSLLSEKYKNARRNGSVGLGSADLFSGFWTGLRSNLSAKENENGFSSQIYILKRN
jgi:SAM-dependent methyltransferase